jgi:hypothetical protein
VMYGGEHARGNADSDESYDYSAESQAGRE